MKSVSGEKERILIIEERDMDGPHEYGCAETVTILFLPVAYSGVTIQETAKKMIERNSELWGAIVNMLVPDVRIEFY